MILNILLRLRKNTKYENHKTEENQMNLKMKKSSKENRIVVIGDLKHCDGVVNHSYSETGYKLAIVIDNFYKRLNEIERSYRFVDDIVSVFSEYVQLIAKSEEEKQLFDKYAETLVAYLCEYIPYDSLSDMYTPRIESIDVIVDNVVYELDYTSDDVNNILHEMSDYFKSFE